MPKRFEGGGLGLRAPTTRRVPRSPWPAFRRREPRFSTSGSTSGMCWKRALTTGRSLPYRARPRSPRSVHPVLGAPAAGILPYDFTAKVTVCVFTFVPAVAVNVIVAVPAAAAALAASFTVVLPLPGAAKEAGVNAAVTPAGNP